MLACSNYRNYKKKIYSSHKGTGSPKNEAGNSSKTHEERNVCFRCGKGPHKPEKCRYKNYTCKKCKKVGHLYAMCNAVKYVEETGEAVNIDRNEDSDPFAMFHVSSPRSEQKYGPLTVEVEIDGKSVNMEVDTGASMTIIPENLYTDKFTNVKLTPCEKTFLTYSGETLQLLGQAAVVVKYEKQSKTLPLIVAKVNEARTGFLN